VLIIKLNKAVMLSLSKHGGPASARSFDKLWMTRPVILSLSYEIASCLAMTFLVCISQFVIVISIEFLNSLISEVITTSPGFTPSCIST
jgi:hypothetical protein